MKRKSENNNIPPTISFKRTFEHIDGNWPTFIYIPVRTNSTRALCQMFNNCIHHFIDTFCMDNNQISIDTKSTHISLSKTFTLRYHQHGPFIDALGKAFQSKIQFIIGLISKYYFLENEDKSRLFLCLPITDWSNRLTDLIDCTDNVLIKFNKNFDVFYKNPKFHISIASMLPISINTMKNESNCIDSIHYVPQSYTTTTTAAIGQPHINYFSIFDKNENRIVYNDKDDSENDDDNDDFFRSIKMKNQLKSISMKDISEASYSSGSNSSSSSRSSNTTKTSDCSSSSSSSKINSSSNNNSSSSNNNISSSSSNSTKTADCNSSTVMAANSDVICSAFNLCIDSIECKIGDRLFRLTLRTNASSNVTEFKEVFD